MVLPTYTFNFDEKLGSSDEQVLATIISDEDFDGDGFKDIKITLALTDTSNSGTEDLIGIAFDIGDDSLIDSLGLNIGDITTDTNSVNTDSIIGKDAVTDNFGAINIAGGGVDAPYDAAVQFNLGGESDGSVQEASFVISGNQDLTPEYVKAILDNTDWYLRLQSTDGGEESAKTGGLVLIPEITIDTVTNGSDGLTILAGTDVTWTYTVGNTGSAGLSNVIVSDDQGEIPIYLSGDTDGDGILDADETLTGVDSDGDGKLDAGETWIYEATGTAVAEDYSNIGTAVGTYELNTVSDADSSNYFGANPDIAIDNVTNGTDGLEILAGSDVTWTYTVTNTGNVDLTNLSVTDDQGVVVNFVSGDDNGDGILQTSETWIYEGTGTAIVGDYSNIGTVVGEYIDDLGNIANPTDSDGSNYFGIEPPTSETLEPSPVEQDGGVANTPGFWKQEQHFQYWVSPYNPDDLFTETFGVDANLNNDSLLAALDAKGGGTNTLARSATAGLLNAASDESGSGINYTIDENALAISVEEVGASLDDIIEVLNIIDLNSDLVIGTSEVISAVQDALTDGGDFNGKGDIISVAQAFDAMNNMPSLEVELF